MKARGSLYLKLAGIAEILIGLVSIVMTMWILSVDPSEFVAFNVEVAHESLWVLVVIYGTAVFQVLAGLVALALSNKPEKANICLGFGMLLVLLQIIFIGKDGYDTTAMIINGILLIAPSLYVGGAMFNKQQLTK